MPQYNRYYPNYERIYAGVEIKPEVMRVLRSSDRKMRYMEKQVKTEQFKEDSTNHTITVLPQREVSLEYLMEKEMKQFASEDNLEKQILFREDVRLLRMAIQKLKKEYRQVIYYRYWRDLTQKETAQRLSITQQGVSYLEQQALFQLRSMLKEKI